VGGRESGQEILANDSKKIGTPRPNNGSGERMPLPEYVRVWLAEFDNSPEPIDYSMISLILYTRLQERQTSPDDEKAIFRMLAPLEFHARPGGGSHWGIYFSPKHVGEDSNAGDIDYPDLSALDAAAVDEWAALAGSFANPALKARFADAVWELAPKLAPSRRDRYRFAIIAAESYLQAARERRYGNPGLQLEPMARAVSLSLSVNSSDLTKRSAEYSLDFANSTDPANMGLWMAPFDKILPLRGLPKIYRERIFQQFEARFEESIARRDLHASTMAGLTLAQYHYVRKNYDRAKEVTRAYGELKLELTATMTASIAVHHISCVLEDYRRQGLREDADRVRLLLEDRAKGVAAEMKPVWIPIRIDAEKVDRFTREVLDVDDPYIALFRIAYHTLPDVDRIRELLAARAEGFMIRHLVPTSITGENGLPVAVVNTYEDDQHGNLVMETARAMNFDSVYLLKSLDEWKKKFGLEGIQETPDLYDSPLIVKDRIPFFRDGLVAYEVGDYLKATHVLIPQVENCLRKLLELLNVSPTKSSGEGDGTYELKNMYDALHEKGVREALEDKVWYFLKALYVDNCGLNLRNLMSHGIAEYNAFNQLNAALVVQSIVLLSIVRPSAVSCAEDAATGTDEGTAEASPESDPESGEDVS